MQASACSLFMLLAFLMCRISAGKVAHDTGTCSQGTCPSSFIQFKSELGRVRDTQGSHEEDGDETDAATDHATFEDNLVELASDNGKKFECDTTKLNTNMCYFVATADNDIGGAYPHDIDPCNEDGEFRKVVDSTGADLAVSPKPWQTGDTLAASDTEVTGDLLLYAKAFEMMAPLRNFMMYEPQVLKDDKDLWDSLTQPLKDCSVKDDDEQGDHGTAYSRDNIYEILKDNKGKDSHHNILQFLEEAVIDLVCAMTSENSLPEFSRCLKVPERSSSCWEDAYDALQEECGDDTSPSPEPPVPEPTPETTKSAPVPAPETTKSPVPAPPPPKKGKKPARKGKKTTK